VTGNNKTDNNHRG